MIELLFLAAFSGAFVQDYVVMEPSPTKIACPRSQRMDFRNYRFTLRGPDKRSGVVILRNGKTNIGAPGSTDWETTLQSQRRLNLSGEAGPTWAVEIFHNHIGGSGSYSRLFVLGCMDGKITELVQAGGEGMRVHTFNDHRFVLTFGVWYPEDAHCCPSGEKKVFLRWNGAKRSFEIEGQRTSKRQIRGR